MAEILRKATSAEEKDFEEIGVFRRKQTFKDKYLAQRDAQVQEHTKRHTPYCGRCAKIDFEDMQEAFLKEQERRSGMINFNQLAQQEFRVPDVKEYGKPKRFVEGKHQEIIEHTLIGTSRVPRLTGYYVDFICQQRGCKIAVQIPLQEYQQRYAKDKKNAFTTGS